jgi:signal transduction histidine kinase
MSRPSSRNQPTQSPVRPASREKANRNQNGLSERYATALRRHLKENASANFQSALKLGRDAVALGVETLDLARMHERALIALELSGAKNGVIKRAGIFFCEAITPIVETHRAARQNKVELNRLNETLNRRTRELTAANYQLKAGILRRKCVETALKESGVHYTKLLKDSLQLQEGLRQLTHRVLAAQEDERKKISIELQDEIAQTLLGINVRLLSLKQEAKANTKGLRNEIASTQRLVIDSAKSVRRVAREFRNS